MALKRSKSLILLLLLMNALSAQYKDFEADTNAYSSPVNETSVNNNNDYSASDVFSDSTRQLFNSQVLEPPISESNWEKIFSKVDFPEADNKKDTTIKKSKKTKKTEVSSTNSFSVGNLSWLWYSLAIAVFIGVMVFLLPWFKTHNKRNIVNEDILFGDENPDEEALFRSNIRKSYQLAYEKGDYKTAFRLLYLDTLKRFVEKNWIVYRKEKTNFDYLMQLSSKPVYNNFSRLTMAFDEIWYGDIVPNKQQFDFLLGVFSEIESEVKRA